MATVWQGRLAANRDRNLEELIELLRIPSVSTDPAHVGDVMQAAKWVQARLTRAGAENAVILPTGPHACVYADWLHAQGKPTILIYGHFDVQPADPLELWESPPFEPVVKEGRVVARGASDMKGNLLLSILAFEAVLGTEGALPVNVKFLFEGQEEIGSRDLHPFVTANREKLACDLVLSADGGQWTEDQPAMWMGTKGLCALQVDLETAGMDLHSGIYGGGVPNACHAMVELLGTLHSSDGSILVDGFYDQVVPLTAEERTAFAAVPYNETEYRTSIGVDALLGEPGYSTYERTWGRPTLEINGVWGGFQGDGVKTVIPAKAHAKITCRLVADQDPEVVLDRIQAHLNRNKPRGARLSMTRLPATARAYHLPMYGRGVGVVAQALHDSYGRAPVYVRTGGTLPITEMFRAELGAYTIMLGFGL